MRKIVQFIRECGAEMKKVVWPTRTDVTSETVVVLISTLIIAAVLGLLDFVFMSGMQLVF